MRMVYDLEMRIVIKHYYCVSNLSCSVLKTFETRIYGERECTTPRWHHNLKNDWWHKIVPYVLYASACGSLSAVKYFIACGQEPNIRYMHVYIRMYAILL